MSIELAMVRLVGAGVAVWATGLGIPAPVGSIADGVRIVDGLSRAGRQETADLLANMTARIWAELGQCNVSMTDAEQYISGLPVVFEKSRLERGVLQDAVAQAEAEKFDDGDVSNIARHLALKLSDACRNTRTLQEAELEAPLTFVLAEWIFASLLANHNRIAAMAPALAGLLSPSAAGSVKSAKKTDVAGIDEPVEIDALDDESCLAAKIPPSTIRTNLETATDRVRPADDLRTRATAIRFGKETGLGVKAIEELIRINAKTDKRPPDASALLRTHISAMCSLIRQLKSVGGTMSMESGLRATLKLAADALSDGDFSEAGKMLQKAELAAAGRLPRSKGHGSMLPIEQTYQVLGLKTVRGKYFELVRSWREAATNYETASRLLPDTARYERWRLMVKSAAALGKLGTLEGNTDALIEAAQIYAEAGGLVSEQDNPSEWAQAHLELGRVLMLIGKREGRPARFLAAALHFKPAADVLLRNGQHTEWARAELDLAQALKAQGEVQGDVVTLREAVEGFRKAIGIITREADFEAWIDAQCGLGTALQRICEETGDSTELPTAMSVLETVLEAHDKAEGSVICEAQAAMARAKILLAADTGNVDMLEHAINLLKNVRVALRLESNSHELADVERYLGTAIWSYSDARGEGADLREAVAAFESALGRYETQGDEANAEYVREHIAELRHQLESASASAG